jgi:cardiolipin synthase C
LHHAFETLPGELTAAQVTLLDGNVEAWAARWELIAGATQSIDAAYFIIEHDVFGMAFLAHLHKKAKEGVEVRLLVDARGTGPLVTPLRGRDYLQELVGTGNVTIHIYNPPLLRVTDAMASVSMIPPLASNHDKILIADAKRAIIGGRNISRDYFVPNHELAHATLDSDMLLEGHIMGARLQRAMLEEFYAPRREHVTADRLNAVSRDGELRMHYYAMDAFLRGVPPDLYDEERPALSLEAAANSKMSRLASWRARKAVRVHLEALVKHQSLYGSLEGRLSLPRAGLVRLLRNGSRASAIDFDVAGGVLRALAGAQHRVLIQSPYLVLTADMLAVLENLAARGVVIDVLTNSPRSSDNDFAQALFIDAWPEILSRVHTMRLFVVGSDQLMHAKRMVIDDNLTLLGTFNLEPLSAHVNSEVVAAVWAKTFARESRQEIENRLSQHDIFEYSIERDERGGVRRSPVAGSGQGKIIVKFGPDDHTSAAECRRLRRLRLALLPFERLIDFQPVVW